MSEKHERFYVIPRWDDEAKVFYSESNIIGLHIEAETMEEFEEILYDSAAEYILANHISPEELEKSKSPSDLLRDLAPRLIIKCGDSASANSAIA